MTTTVDRTNPSWLADYLKIKNDFSVANGCAAPPEWAHFTYEGMVLDLGQPCERKPMPVGFRRMRSNHCFGNAIHCVLRDGGDRYRYVEGYAAGIIVTEHAWVLDTLDGKIFDPTWPRDDRHTHYYGIVLPTAFVWKRTLDVGYYGLLACDYMEDNYLLRNGRSAWADFEEAR